MSRENKDVPWDSFYNGQLDSINSLYEVETLVPHSISLMDRLGDPVFLKNSSLILRVVEEIYRDIRKRAVRLENKKEEV